MSENVERIGRVCHEINRAYCAAIGDHSQPPWEKAPDWQKASAIAGVEAALADPRMTPGDSHRGWLKQKFLDGWSHGPEKDPAKKLHPCMVNFEDLPREQQVKDHLFLAVVRALA